MRQGQHYQIKSYRLQLQKHGTRAKILRLQHYPVASDLIASANTEKSAQESADNPSSVANHAEKPPDRVGEVASKIVAETVEAERINSDVDGGEDALQRCLGVLAILDALQAVYSIILAVVLVLVYRRSLSAEVQMQALSKGTYHRGSSPEES